MATDVQELSTYLRARGQLRDDKVAFFYLLRELGPEEKLMLGGVLLEPLLGALGEAFKSPEVRAKAATITDPTARAFVNQLLQVVG